MASKKADKTKKRIIDAYFTITKETGKAVTISGLCEYLDIYRSTFYNYFSGIEELEQEVNRLILDERIHNAIEEGNANYDFRKMVTFIAKHTKEKKQHFLALINLGADASFTEEYKYITEQNIKQFFSLGNSIEDKLLLAFLSEGLRSALLKWLESGATNEEEFIEFVCKTVGKIMY